MTTMDENFSSLMKNRREIKEAESRFYASVFETENTEKFSYDKESRWLYDKEGRWLIELSGFETDLYRTPF